MQKILDEIDPIHPDHDAANRGANLILFLVFILGLVAWFFIAPMLGKPPSSGGIGYPPNNMTYPDGYYVESPGVGQSTTTYIYTRKK